MGTPAGVETQFMIEGAMDKVLDAALGKVRSVIQVLEKLEQQMVDDQELLAVNQVDEIGIRGTEMRELREEYQFHRNGLANLLGIYPNPFDKRFYNNANMNATVALCALPSLRLSRLTMPRN